MAEDVTPTYLLLGGRCVIHLLLDDCRRCGLLLFLLFLLFLHRRSLLHLVHGI